MIRRRLFHAVAATLFVASFGGMAHAQTPQSPESSAVFDQKAVQLLRRMVESERAVPYIARESTIRADGPGAEHVVKFDPKRGLRREPANGRGRVVLDTPQRSYRFSLDRPDDIAGDDSRFTRIDKRVKELIMRLGKRFLSAQVVGSDTVAGRVCDIVEVRATRIPDAPTRRFWIDRETGLRLRTEEKNAQGKVLSGSYYTSLDLSPDFSPGDFLPPRTRDKETGSNEKRADKRGGHRFKTVAEARQAGVVTPEPAYLPSGYTLRQVEATKRGAHVALRYANGLNALSLAVLRDGMPPRVSPFLRPDGSAYVPFPQGKHGLFVRGENGAAYLLIGDLPESELRKIAASVR
ncbi:MAG: hypothetical protein H7145_08270 [Akkermansiaceae bacterium]|nr:hypothetical protein [Armatimonadota bacterium]